MGCDGGTIPKRDELVKTKKKPEKKDKVSELSFRWRHCSVSQQPLQQPIVSCRLGKLYNKDVVIEKLLEKTPMPEIADHIKSLKDIKDLKLTRNPAFVEASEKGDAYIDHQASPYICPVTSLEMNGIFKFMFPWSCGCVFSERALKLVKDKNCVSCQKPFSDSDLIILNSVDEDLELMKKNLAEKAIKVKQGKKQKKIKPGSSASVCSAEVTEIPAKQEKETRMEELKTVTIQKETKVEECKQVNAEKKTKTEELKTVPVEKETKVEDGKEKKAKNMNGLKRSTADVAIEDPAYKKTKPTYQISKDPQTSGVYKSLFTSHEDAKKGTKAHWVTYNPFYN